MGNGLCAILVCYNYEFRLDIDQYKFMVSNEETTARARPLFHFSVSPKATYTGIIGAYVTPVVRINDSNGQNGDVNAITH
jgi:hypothetical protein